MHGDTAHGEVAALEALGSAEAAFVSDLMWQRHLKGEFAAAAAPAAPAAAAPAAPAGTAGAPSGVPPSVAPGAARTAAELGLRVLDPLPRFDHCQFSAVLRGVDGAGVVSAGGGRAALRRLRAFQRALFAMDGRGHAEDARTMELEGLRAAWAPPRGGLLSDNDSAPLPDARAGYEGTLAALEAFGEPRVRWPGQLHTAARHPFRALMVDSRVVPDLYGC